MNLNFILRQHGQIAATGKMENCVFSLVRQRPLRLNAINFPEDFAEDVPNDIPDFIQLKKSTEGMIERYRRTVRMSDLDKSNHMTNLRYIDMFQDACDTALWKTFDPKEMEIAFLSQAREGEELTILSKQNENEISLAAIHSDGKIASVAMFRKH